MGNLFFFNCNLYLKTLKIDKYRTEVTVGEKRMWTLGDAQEF